MNVRMSNGKNTTIGSSRYNGHVYNDPILIMR